MRRTIDLNQNWAFRLDAAVPEVFPEDWETVDLPHTWNAADGQDGGNDYRRTRGVYAKRLPLKPLDLSKVFLEVNGSAVDTVELPSYPAMGTVATDTDDTVPGSTVSEPCACRVKCNVGYP